MKRPKSGEFPPYHQNYIDLVKDNNPLQTLTNAWGETTSFLKNLSETQWDYRYAPNKWNIKEIFIHLIDAERIFAYRALRIARNDSTPLLGFEQDDYVPFSGAKYRTPASIVEEYQSVRKASLSLFQSFSDDMWTRIGTASNHPISVLALAYIMAGHEIHHLNIIKERYL